MDVTTDVRQWGGGRYVGVDLLGRGGTAEVWRAEDRIVQRHVAVKAFVPGDLLADPESASRFRTEVRLMGSLTHPHVVPLWDADVSDGRMWCVMPLAEGGSLDRPRPAGRSVDLLTVGAQVADALAYLHAHDVVHRDLKPSNILLDGDGRALLSDFGIARSGGLTRITRTGVLVGTAAYLAPEQVRGEGVTPACDLYAFGLVLLELLTGHREYDGPPVEAAVARLTRPPVLPAGLGPAWTELLAAMTSNDPGERPTAYEARRALLDLRDGRWSAPAPAAAAPSRPERGARRRATVRNPAVALAAAGCLAAGGLALSAWTSSSPDAVPATSDSVGGHATGGPGGSVVHSRSSSGGASARTASGASAVTRKAHRTGGGAGRRTAPVASAHSASGPDRTTSAVQDSPPQADVRASSGRGATPDQGSTAGQDGAAAGQGSTAGQDGAAAGQGATTGNGGNSGNGQAGNSGKAGNAGNAGGANDSAGPAGAPDPGAAGKGGADKGGPGKAGEEKGGAGKGGKGPGGA